MAAVEQYAGVASLRRVTSLARGVLEPFAIQDWIVGAYLLVLSGAAALGSGPMRNLSLVRMSGLLLVYVAAMFLARLYVRNRVSAALLYRVAIYGSVQLSYFWLRDLLAAATHRMYDAELHVADLRLFGVEPSLWAERFVSTTTTEWFAFFYFGYFLVLAVHVLPMLFFSKRTALLAEFGFLTITVYCVAQATYLLVPAFGPHRWLAGSFQNDLPVGFWYDAVLKAVRSGGAERDAFPSLHTAGPAALALFSFRHRRALPFKYTWPVTAFFTANIIVATVFLRWHYLIDIIAGLVLAGSAMVAATYVTRVEARRRAQLGLPDVWPAYQARPAE